MKRIIASLAVFASMSFAGSLPAWASSSHECSNATLQGSYGLVGQGFRPAVGHNGGVGLFTFDGNGNISVVATYVNETTGINRTTFSATYNVNPDCTGSGGAGPNTIDFVIVSGGNEVFLISTNEDPPGAQRVVTWVLKKLFPQERD